MSAVYLRLGLNSAPTVPLQVPVQRERESVCVCLDSNPGLPEHEGVLPTAPWRLVSPSHHSKLQRYAIINRRYSPGIFSGSIARALLQSFTLNPVSLQCSYQLHKAQEISFTQNERVVILRHYTVYAYSTHLLLQHGMLLQNTAYTENISAVLFLSRITQCLESEIRLSRGGEK